MLTDNFVLAAAPNVAAALGAAPGGAFCDAAAVGSSLDGTGEIDRAANAVEGRQPNLPFIVNVSSLFDKEAFRRFLRYKGWEERLIVEADNLEICKQYVLRRAGIAFMPRFYVASDIRDGTLAELESIPEAIVPARSIDAVWLKTSDNRLVDALLGHLAAQTIRE